MHTAGIAVRAVGRDEARARHSRQGGAGGVGLTHTALKSASLGTASYPSRKLAPYNGRVWASLTSIYSPPCRHRVTETRYTQDRSWCGVGGGPVQTTALLQRTGSQDRASSATVRPRQRLCRPQARHLLATSLRSQPAPAALVWRQPHGSRNKGAVSRLPGRVGETAALWHQAWKAVHVWMQEASSTQIFYGLAPQPNCSGAAHDLKVIKEDVGEDRRRRHGAWVWQALVANCQRTYSRIGVVGRTDRMRLSVSADKRFSRPTRRKSASVARRRLAKSLY